MVPLKLPSVGDRIECSGQFGTVMYVGVIQGYADTWLGIDWDDETRGKHDGTVKGIRYFTARHEYSGSCVRPEKVHLGQSAIEAITSRYGQLEDAAEAKFTEQQLMSIQQSINAPFLKMVGFEKIANIQSDFHSLQVVNLRLQNVCNLGGPNALQALCPNITELDISKNLLTNWNCIFNVCLQLEQLHWLNVCENCLEIPDDYMDFCFPKMKVLICGDMRMDWASIIKLSRVFPNLEELRAPNNRITTIEEIETLSQLKLLDLEGNPIQEWAEIAKLTFIATLEHINLENTGIRRIEFNEGNIFGNLKKLVLSGNLINDWESIGELNKLPNLEHLRFLRNPIMDTETYSTCIQLIVARIENLQMFNGGAIRPEERKGAEYDYIKKYGLEWLSVRDDPEKKLIFLKAHNRYEELIDKHGTPEESELRVQSKLIKVSLIEIEFIHRDRSVRRKLPPSILIQKLIMLAQRMFNLSSRPSLTYISGVQSEIQIHLNDEGKELGFYSVQDQDKIIVGS